MVARARTLGLLVILATCMINKALATPPFCTIWCQRGRGGNICKCSGIHFPGKRNYGPGRPSVASATSQSQLHYENVNARKQESYVSRLPTETMGTVKASDDLHSLKGENFHQPLFIHESFINNGRMPLRISYNSHGSNAESNKGVNDNKHDKKQTMQPRTLPRVPEHYKRDDGDWDIEERRLIDWKHIVSGQWAPSDDHWKLVPETDSQKLKNVKQATHLRITGNADTDHDVVDILRTPLLRMTGPITFRDIVVLRAWTKQLRYHTLLSSSRGKIN